MSKITNWIRTPKHEDAFVNNTILCSDEVKEYIAGLENLAEMVMDNTKMPHQHSDLQTRLYCLSERAREVLKR